MALTAKKGVLTSADTVIALPAGSDLKALIFWTAQHGADAVVDGHGLAGIGFATKDGGVIQKGYQWIADDDVLPTSNVLGGLHTTAALKGWASASGAVDFVMDVSAMAAESFTVAWTDAPAATVRVHYLALGGSDITAARVFSKVFASGAQQQDVTIAAGFGQPDLLLMTGNTNTALADAPAFIKGSLQLGIAKSATERRCASYWVEDNASNMSAYEYQHDRAFAFDISGNVSFDLTDRASWPVDGFRTDWLSVPGATPAAPTRAFPMIGLALKGTFKAAIGSGAIPTAAAPQVQSHALAASTPRAALICGGSQAAGTVVVSGGADLGGFFLGGTDGTAEGSIGVCQDDLAADSAAGRFHSETKAYRVIKTDAGAPAIQSEADSALPSTGLDLTWTDTDTVARAYSVLILGDAVPAGDVYVKSGGAFARKPLKVKAGGAFADVGVIVQ